MPEASFFETEHLQTNTVAVGRWTIDGRADISVEFLHTHKGVATLSVDDAGSLIDLLQRAVRARASS